MSQPNPGWVSTGQAARRIGVSQSYVVRMIRLGELRAERNSLGYHEIDPQSLEEFIERREHGPRRPPGRRPKHAQPQDEQEQDSEAGSGPTSSTNRRVRRNPRDDVRMTVGDSLWASAALAPTGTMGR